MESFKYFDVHAIVEIEFKFFATYLMMFLLFIGESFKYSNVHVIVEIEYCTFEEREESKNIVSYAYNVYWQVYRHNWTLYMYSVDMLTWLQRMIH